MEISELTIQLNARLRPKDRHHYFGIPIKNRFEKIGFGSIIAAGTLTSKNGEIEYCDIAIETNQNALECRDKLIKILNEIGTPKGSKIFWNECREEIDVGSKEGLVLYLNGTDLSNEIYLKYSLNEVWREVDLLLQGIGRIMSYWSSQNEVALYLYGNSFEEMKKKITPFINQYPLCKKCRIEQIA
jgi:hypothetical protein